jgi:colicin import membrane protein
MNSSSTFPSSPSPFKRGRLTKEESTKRALTFSLIVHLGLVAFLVIGISWNNSTPSGVEVELWDSTPQVQIPLEPELKTLVKEEAADIAVKKKIVEKEPPKKEVVKETPKAVKPPPPIEKEKPKKEEPPKKAEAPKALSPAETKANPALDKARNDLLAKRQRESHTDNGSGGTVGSGVGKGGSAQAGWREKIIRDLKKNRSAFNTSSINGNPAVTIVVKLAPDGVILERKITSSSGSIAWDNAVLESFDKIQRIPKDDDGNIPEKILELKFRPND